MTVNRVNWNHPSPRSGFLGYIDKGMGPGATWAEYVLQLVLPGGAALFAYLYAETAFPAWPWWKVLLYCVLAFDMVGGVVTNSTSSAKRWFHRATQTWRNHLGFVVLHVAHIALVATLFRDFDLIYLVAMAGYLTSAAILTLLFPLYLQRAIALFLVTLGMVLEIYGWGALHEIAWFTPLLLLKLLVAHLLREEPYRPPMKGH
ncbi:MAG: hypothetical protein P1U69_01160 [Parvibaculaceae bacterium]|nr:hypothetical protein [Parvibaculaceae bacterium]